MFDLTLQIIGFNLHKNKDNIEVQLVVGLPLPFAQNGGEPLIAPVGALRFFLRKAEGTKLGEEILENIKDLSDPVDLFVPNADESVKINQATKNADNA